MAVGPAIAGGVAAGAAGSLLGGGGNSSANDTQERFVGFNTQGGLFDPRLIKGGKGQDDTVDFGIGGPIGSLQNQLIGSSAGLFGQSGNAAQAGQLGSDFLSSLGSTDPLELQRQLYGQISPQLIAQQNQDFFDMEGRLFGQGRLGSTPGNQQLDTLFDSQGDARNRLLFDSFGQALNAQNQQFNIGSQLSQLDPQLRGLFSGVGNQQLAAALGIQGGANDTFRLGAATGGASRISEHSGGQPIGGGGFFDSLGAGLVNSGVGQVMGGVNGLFQGGGVSQPWLSGTGNFLGQAGR